ncbi:hypothetical protein K2Z83_15365 [Oscillochloris sp. ZM17-4]|uniref:hypothetical protein n=1 Tax=Oscillochloris sp. ZM17-4 TaxID=2866714 RepID=UPI001C735C5E|nr:hypothetical protein [Oscillochloris sp. ZM17-4]MBX0329057.1 hypothetical protein [Oscillochloris sp. ZM17-4]
MTHAQPWTSAVLLIALGAALLLSPAPARAQGAGSCGATGTSGGAIVLDGQFGDWGGQSCIPDPADDCSSSRADLAGFFFATVADDPTAYFMAETFGGSNQTLSLQLRIDTNNDGSYSSAADRIVVVSYKPGKNSSKVDIDVLDGRGEKVAEISRDVDWGESQADGGHRVEWGVSFAQLGIQAGQTMRMTLDSKQGNGGGSGWCDSSQEVQWSPADALGLGLLLVIVLGVAGLAARMRARQA